MTRKEIYVVIKNWNLADEIKNEFGDNYTRISNAELEDFIDEVKAAKAKLAKKSTKKATDTNVDVKSALVRLVSVLQSYNIINSDEGTFVLTGK